jgi:hypothetical protein
MKLFLTFASCLMLLGCSSQNTATQAPLAPPNAVAGDTQIKYSKWDDKQLVLKRNQIRGELNRPYGTYGPPLLVMMAQSKRDAQFREVEEIERELLRRDPSGGLLHTNIAGQ